MSFVQRFERNMLGHDWVVGDIHGCFSRLEQALTSIAFDPVRDRLFSVGDLVDRGPESHRVLEWISKPWFHAVQGNHEDLAIRYVDPGKRDTAHYAMNGGAWLIAMTSAEQREYAAQLTTLPYAIEVETVGGPVGIVHADVPHSSWRAMVDAFAAADSRNKLRRITDDCLWCRDRIQSEDVSGVPDMRAVIVGHTPLRRPAVLGNVFHIDTAGWRPEGYFTFLDLDTLMTAHPESC